jgi:hypothetical protein
MTADIPPRELDTRKQDLRDAHALAIGRIVIAWNEFQEDLGLIFARLFHRTDYRSALAAWHALENDRAQREMLRAVAKLKLGSESKAFRETNWLLEQAHQQLSNQRNFGIHTPLIVHWDNRDNVPPERVFSMVPLDMFGNRRAAAMTGKDLLKEFAHYEEQIRKMSSFASLIEVNLSPRRVGPESWPERPQLQFPAPPLNPKA